VKALVSRKKMAGPYNKKKRVNKLRSDAVWDVRLCEMAIKLLAGGATFDDIGYILGVKGETVQTWRDRYPDFRAAADAGHTASNARTLGEMLRCAWGFEYKERTVKRQVILDEEGEEVNVPGETSKAVITEHTKYQPPNADLLKFIALNRLSGEFKDSKRIEIEDNRTIKIVGADEAKAIDEFIVKYLESVQKPKLIESNVVEADFEKQGI
jgi:hypothetical protein